MAYRSLGFRAYRSLGFRAYRVLSLDNGPHRPGQEQDGGCYFDPGISQEFRFTISRVNPSPKP